MDLPQGFKVIEDQDPSIPEGFSLIPEGFSLLDENENEPLTGAMEAGMSMASGLPAMIAGGLHGLVTGDASNVEKTQRALTYEPRSKTGQKYNEWVAENMEKYVRQPMIRGLKPIGMGEHEAELVSTITTDTILNLAPVGAGAKAISSVSKGIAARKAKAPVSPKLSKLDEIAQRKKAEAEAKPPIHVDSEGVATEGLPTQINEPPDIVEFARQEALKKEQAAKGTVYVDSQGQASKELGTVIKEDPMVTDQARDIQQNVLEDRARELGKGMGETPDLLNEPPVQQNLPKASFRSQSRQRGAIDVEAVKSVTDAFVRGLGTARDVLKAWKGAFSEMEMAKALHAIDQPKSLDTIALMSPDDFLRMAAPRHPEEMTKWAPRLHDSIKEGLKSKGGLWEIPYLRIGADGKVMAHEGRHRMDVFKEQGHSLVPVRLRKEADAGPWSKQQPNYMLSEKNLANGAPDSIPFPEIMSTKTGAVTLPARMRGGIDAKAVGDSMKALKDKVQKPDTEVPTEKADAKMVHPEDAILNLPGNKKALKNMIPPDPTPEAIIEAALSEKDSTLTWGAGVQSGATLTGMKYDSSIISGVGRLYQNAGKRSELAIRDRVYPVEHTIKNLSRLELFELGEIMKREMFDEQQFTLAELAEAGFNPKQIEAYKQMRQMQKEALQAQNIALEKQGKKPITEREAYLSSRWSGDWRVPVYDKKGKLIWYIAEKSRAKANKALQYIKDNGFDIDEAKSKVEFTGGTGKQRGNLQDAYTTMLSIIDSGDPRAQVLKSVMEDGMANDAFNTLGQKQHFKEKANVRGFIGDRPWNDPISEAFDLFKEQFEYTKNAYTWAELSEATRASKEVLSNPELVKSQPNNVNYAQRYAKTKLGFGENQAIASLEADLAKLLGQDRARFNNIIGGMKSLFILSKLGFNTGFMMANYVQPLWTAPHHVMLSKQGFNHNPFTTFVLGGYDGFNGYLRYQGKKAPMSDLGIEALKYAEDNGIVSRDMFDESAGLGKHGAIEMAEKTAGITIKGIEHMARLNAFMSFIHHLDQSGAFKDKMQMFQKAEEQTTAAMVDYRPGERPMVFDQLGTTGSAMSALQTFKFNYYNQLALFYGEAKKGNPGPLLAFIAMQGTIGGALSMPFLQELDDVWELVKSMLPDSVLMNKSIRDFGIKKWMVEHMNDLFSYGGASKITGANMTSRFDSGNLADFSFDALFPFMTDLYKQGAATADFVTNPNKTTAASAAYALAPPGPLQGMVETGMDAFKGNPTAAGNVPYKNPRKLEQHDASYVRTPTQENYRKFGLTELEEAKYKEQRYRQGTVDKLTSERMATQATKFFDALERGDKIDIKKYVHRYIAYGGDPQTIFNRIDEEAMKAQVPSETLAAAKAETMQAIQKAKRMKELLNGFNK